MSRKTGFGVIEFVVIIGVVALFVVFGMPKYLQLQARSVQEDARINLLNIDKQQHNFRFDKDRFAQDLTELSFQLPENSVYKYRIIQADANGYVAEAEAAAGALSKCASRDVWTINQDKTITNTVNGVKSCNSPKK
jgi:Tfp pilus assembly protein PilE